MKRKNSIVLKKQADVLFLNEIKKNNLYKSFRSKTFKYINKKNFSLGVSGGTDSLCLALLSKAYSLEFKNKIHVFIVDHKLRYNSSKEAHKVKNILKEKGISSRILTWKGNIPKKNIQLKAREIRYSLIAKKCNQHKIKFLVTAHHQDDQVETFLMRLFRGSGLNGLSSMSEEFKFDKNLKIIRPFLNFNKKSLSVITKKYFDSFINDPSNTNKKFFRSRIRKYRKTFDKEGFDVKKIIKTVSNLSVAKNALEFYKKKSVDRHVKFIKNQCVINMGLFKNEAEEIVFRSFCEAFSLFTKSYYPPRSKKIVDLIKRIKNKEFKKCTLAGCVIEKSKGLILIRKEF